MTFSLSQDCLAGLARQSTAKMEIEGPQGPQERQADLACRAPWGCQASVSLQPALEPQPTPLHASRSLDPSKGREHQAKTEPSGHPGGRTRSPWVDMHPIPQPRKASFPRTFCLGPRSPKAKEIPKHRGREGRAWSEKVRLTDRASVAGESKVQGGWGGFPLWSTTRLSLKPTSPYSASSSTGHFVLGASGLRPLLVPDPIFTLWAYWVTAWRWLSLSQSTTSSLTSSHLSI